MGWFSGIKTIFSAEKAVDGLFSTKEGSDGMLARIGTWVGNQKYTPEERAEMDSKTRDWSIRFMNAMVPFKIAQRWIAFTIIGMWAFLGVNYVICVYLDAIFKTALKLDIYNFATSDFMVFPTTCVLTLYFLGGVWPSRSK